jgi:DNA polymerase-1
MSKPYIVAFDTETKGFNWWADQTAFIATTHDSKGVSQVFDLSDDQQIDRFVAQLSRADCIVAHNLSFDTHQVFATTGFDLLELDAELRDTDLMARVAWPESTYGEHGGFGLKNLAKVYIDPEADMEEGALKEAGKSIGYRTLNKTGAYYDVWRAHPSVVEAYAMKDAEYTLGLHDLLERELDAPDAIGQRAINELERKVAPVLIRAERRGTMLDQKVVAKLKKDYKRQEREVYNSLSKRWGDKPLGGEGSHDALLEALLGEGIPLHRTTDTGGLSTSQFALQEFERDYPVVSEYLNYRRIEKFLSTYIEPMEGVDVVHPSIRQIGAWTGRMSCMRPNMQNIPVRAGSEVRECFVARPGYKLIVADFEQIEARVVAYYLGTEGQAWRDLINSGEDVHAHMATDLANRGVAPWIEAERVVTQPGQPFVPEDFNKHGVNGKLRSHARHTLFAILYGAGGCRICDQLNLPTGPPLTEGDWVVQRGYKDVGQPSCKQGQEIAKAVKSSIPGYAKFAQRVRRKVEGHGYVTTMLGRKQAISRDKGYVGIAALAQGTAADVMKEAILAADAVLPSFDAHILMIVHDEILAEAPEDRADEALAALQAAMEGAVTCDPPFLTSGVVCDNYGEAK